MPALVTTPANAPITAYFPSPYQRLDSAYTAPPRSGAAVIVNAVATRAPGGYPIRRWNGTSWITVFQPRF